MINLRNALQDDIAAGVEAAQKAGDLPKKLSLPSITIERPDNPEHGDFASPVALALAKAAKMKPLDIVEQIARHMPKKEYIGKLEGVAPGFLNIRINPGWYTARLDDVLEQPLCGDVTGEAGKRVNLEFISANPTGPLTLGNIRTAFTVDTLGNILSCAGYSVTREYYVNDAGGQITKLGESVLRRVLQSQDITVEYPDELYQGGYIAEVGAQVAEELRETEGRELTEVDLEDPEIIALLGERAAGLLLGDIKRTIADDLGITFNEWASERVLRESGIVEDVVKRLKKQKKTYTTKGALYLKTTDYGDSEDRVLVKSDGEYAYIAPDIGYHQQKYDRGFDLIYTFVGADHQGHGPKLVAAMDALGNDVSKLHFVAAQWIRFIREGKPVKLSKRKGEIYSPRDLITEVGYDAARFFMVQHALTTHMDFDLDLAREQSERNPVYYTQYAYVRLQSILRRAKQEGFIEHVGDDLVLTSTAALTHTAEVALLRSLYRLPEVIADCTIDMEAHPLAYYALDLSRAIHGFYGHVPVLGAEDKELTRGRLQLVLAARKVLGQVLDLLGLSKPEVM